MLKSSPLFTTIGLSLTIPMAALGGMAGGTPGGTSSGRGLAAYRAVPIPLATRTPVAGRG